MVAVGVHVALIGQHKVVHFIVVVQPPGGRGPRRGSPLLKRQVDRGQLVVPISRSGERSHTLEDDRARVLNLAFADETEVEAVRVQSGAADRKAAVRIRR